jgi:tight adherence protein C
MPLASLPPSAIAFVVAGAAFLGYGVLAGRGTSTARRVDALRSGPRLLGETLAARRTSTSSSAPPVFRAAAATAPGPMGIEIARRVGIAPELAERLLTIGRLTLGLLLGAGLPALGYAANREFSMLLVVYGTLGFGLGFFGPALIVSRLAAQRLRALQFGLPEAIELLIIAVEAGLALDDAIDRIVVELVDSQPAVAEELALTSADLKILPNREAALGKLAERVDLPSVRSFVNTLSQTMRYGTPLAQALRVVAGELRNDELLRLEENANKMPVLLTIPMVIFMLPSLFLIIGGPTVLKLINLLFR